MFCRGLLFRIIFWSKYSLLRSNIETASMGMAVRGISGHLSENNSKYISHHLTGGFEGMKVWGWDMAI